MTEDTAKTMERCVNAVHGVVGDRQDVVGFVIAILKDDGNCVVVTRADTVDLACHLDGAHDAIRLAIDSVFSS